MLFSKSGLVIMVLLLSNIIFAGSFYNQIKVSNEYRSEIEEKDVSFEKLMNLQKEDIQEKATAYYAQQIQRLLSEHELVFLTQKQWEYILTLNENELKQNTIYINEDSARIILAELVRDEEILPKEILENGTVTGNDPNDLLQDHLSVFTNVSYTTKVDENNQGRRVIYDFKNIPKGTVIRLKISPLLAERLKIGASDHQWEIYIEIIHK